MKRSEHPHPTPPPADNARREAWEELLLRRLLQARSPAEASPEQRWQLLSRHIAAHEQLRAVSLGMALHRSELRNMMMLSRPWPSLLSLFG